MGVSISVDRMRNQMQSRSGTRMTELSARQQMLDEAQELYDLFKDAPFGSATERFASHTLAANIVPALIAALEHEPGNRTTGFGPPIG